MTVWELVFIDCRHGHAGETEAKTTKIWNSQKRNRCERKDKKTYWSKKKYERQRLEVYLDTWTGKEQQRPASGAPDLPCPPPPPPSPPWAGWARGAAGRPRPGLGDVARGWRGASRTAGRRPSQP